MFHALVRPCPSRPPHVARLVGWYRARRRGDAPSRLRSAIDPVRRERLAGDVLHDRDGALADQRDRHRMGAHAVARGATKVSWDVFCDGVRFRKSVLVGWAKEEGQA
jgi:hypothetical protein